MDPQISKIIDYFNNSRKPFDPNNQSSVAYYKQMFDKAQSMMASPNFSKYPVELRSAITEAVGNLQASLSKSTGVKVSNKWDEFVEKPIPFKKYKK